MLILQGERTTRLPWLIFPFGRQSRQSEQGSLKLSCLNHLFIWGEYSSLLAEYEEPAAQEVITDIAASSLHIDAFRKPPTKVEAIPAKIYT